MNFPLTRVVALSFLALLFHLFFSYIVWHMRYSSEKNKIFENRANQKQIIIFRIICSRKKFLGN